LTLIVCAGTGTEVGKTWTGAAVLSALRAAGVRVAARKLVQSFDSEAGEPTDAEVLAAATGEAAATVCTPERWLPVPMAPPMAAEALGQPPITLAELIAGLSWPDPHPDIAWVEAVGGVRSPLASDGDTVDLCRALRPDVVVLVADAGLGVINLVRMSVEALGPWPVIVVLNRFREADPLHIRNLDWLRERDGFEVLRDPAELVHRLASG
jgi:dethiobiotin synthetase